MEHTTAHPTLLMNAANRVAERIVLLGENRLEIARVEVQEARDRLLLLLLLALGAGVFAVLAGVALSVTVVLLCWENSPTLAVAILTVLYAGLAGLLVERLLSVNRNWEIMGETLKQFRKDFEWLKHTVK